MAEHGIGCVLMAAGASSRFGADKLSARLGGVSLLRRAALAVPSERLRTVALVTARSEGRALAVEFGFRLVENTEPERGASLTVRLGLEAVRPCDAALFMTAINGTQNTLSPDAVDEAVALLHKARQVYCLGQGGSMLIANDICARFASISTKFRTAGDSHLQLVTASLMTEEDVVLFVSYSGATRDMLETLKVAKAAGAKVILLTHYEDSPGAKMADIVLLCGAQESPLDAGNIPIKVAVLYVAEVLVLRYMLDDPDDANKAQDRTSEALAVKLL
mgnify:CR=1 FL=1